MGLFSATWLKAEAINCLPINMTGGALPCNLDLSGDEPDIFQEIRPLPCLLMPWLLMLPGHQQPWYWLWIIVRLLFIFRVGLNILHPFNILHFQYQGYQCHVSWHHHWYWACKTISGGILNIKMLSYQYRDPHVKDKTVLKPSYL